MGAGALELPVRLPIWHNPKVPSEEPALEDPDGSAGRGSARVRPWRRSMRATLFGLAFLAVLGAIGYQHSRLLAQPEEILLNVVPDDAFYYYQIARHFAAGDGSTFDGTNRASGYHPGWMALLVPLAAAWPSPSVLLRAALSLEFLLHAATAFALIGLFRRYTSPGLALIGGLCWLANPLAILLCLQGVESALYALALVVLLRTVARFVAEPGESLALHVQLGAALAFCFWARTEAGILAVLTLLAAPALKGLPWRRCLRSALEIGVVFTALVLPWFVFCWVATGSPWQSSGAIKLLWGDLFLGVLDFGERIGHALSFVGVKWLSSPWTPTMASPLQKINTFTWAAKLPALLGLLAIGRKPVNRPALFGSVWLLAAMVSTGLVYGLFHWEIQIWYFAQPALLIFVMTYVWIARLGVEPTRLRLFFSRALPALLLALSLYEAQSFYQHPPSLYPWQFQFLISQGQFENLVPPGQAIGCFNAGIPAFYSHRQVINLDGLVNSTVLPYYRAHRFDQYLAEHGIHYIADVQPVLDRTAKFMQHPLRLHPIAAMPLKGWYSPYRYLWQVEAGVGGP